MADLTRHLVNDAWGTACTELADGQSLGISDDGGPAQPLPTKFNQYCFPRNVANEYTSSGALSAYGWCFTIICTWSGFVLLFVGISWALDLPGKIAVQWRQIRARRGAGAGPLLSAA